MKNNILAVGLFFLHVLIITLLMLFADNNSLRGGIKVVVIIFGYIIGMFICFILYEIFPIFKVLANDKQPENMRNIKRNHRDIQSPEEVADTSG